MSFIIRVKNKEGYEQNESKFFDSTAQGNELINNEANFYKIETESNSDKKTNSNLNKEESCIEKNQNENKFLKEAKSVDINIEKAQGTNDKLQPIILSGRLKKNTNRFYGEKTDSSNRSNGSLFQSNIAKFYGASPYCKDQYPVIKLQKNYQEEKKENTNSLLMKMKAPSFENDPKFQKNRIKFFNSSEKIEKNELTYAQRVNKFINPI